MNIFAYLTEFFTELAFLFLEMAPYITLGILIAGLMHIILSKDFVARQVGKNNLASIIKAALFGVPLPLCSCGVVPTAVYLKNSGASKSASLSFLISTPQTGVDSIVATWGMLGPVFAVFRAITALITGIAGGILAFFFSDKGHFDNAPSGKEHQKNEYTAEESTRAPDSEKVGLFGKLRQMVNYAFFELLDDIAIQFVIGLAIAAVISMAIPDDFFAGAIFSNPLASMLLMVVIGIPMYICSTASIPIAVAMILKGLSPGAAYVFLVAGPATNAASLAIIANAFGKKFSGAYLATIISGSLFFGFIMDLVYSRLDAPALSAAHHAGHAADKPDWFQLVVSVFLLAMLLVVLVRKVLPASAIQQATPSGLTKINVQGMTCGHCSANVQKALSTVAGIKKIDVSLEGKCVFIEGDFKLAEAEKAIHDAGYKVAGQDSQDSLD
ncbi:MAG: permease [Spirochaetaceae bacterium]|nr:MAG: permease [Spirochaetaceae bacterium]